MSKFKVGDRVRCIQGIKDHEPRGKSGGYGWQEGLIFVVDRESGGIYWGGYDGNGVYEDWLELATEEPELPDIKLGTWEVNL